MRARVFFSFSLSFSRKSILNACSRSSAMMKKNVLIVPLWFCVMITNTVSCIIWAGEAFWKRMLLSFPSISIRLFVRVPKRGGYLVLAGFIISFQRWLKSIRTHVVYERILITKIMFWIPIWAENIEIRDRYDPFASGSARTDNVIYVRSRRLSVSFSFSSNLILSEIIAG